MPFVLVFRRGFGSEHFSVEGNTVAVQFRPVPRRFFLMHQKNSGNRWSFLSATAFNFFSWRKKSMRIADGLSVDVKVKRKKTAISYISEKRE